MSDVTDRLTALEAAVFANKLPPTIAILQRKLEQNWQPDASVLLQPGSVSAAMLNSSAAAFLAAIGIAVGTDTWTFAAARTSAEKTTTHNAAFTPSKVFVCGATDQGAHVITGHAFTYTASTFKSRGDFTDGTAPTGTSNFVWIAIK